MKTTPTQLDAYHLMHKGILALARAEQQGMRIDVDYCKRKTAHLTRKIEYCENQFKQSELATTWRKAYGGHTNYNSDPQLGRILYEVMGLEPYKETATGKGSTDEEALTMLEMPELNKLLETRKLRKVRDTYLGAFIREQVDGVMRPFFNLHTVITGRSSSNSPNFQNIPKRDKRSMQICRRAIKPRPGHQLLEVDFSQLEVSIAFCYHKDPVMQKYLIDPASDMHGDMAAQIFMLDDFDKNLPEHKYLRDATKNGFVFPQFYGDYHGNNAASLCKWVQLPHHRWKKGQGVKLPGGIHISDHLISKGIKSYEQFVQHLKKIEDDFWGRRFRVYQKWKDIWLNQYKQNGYFDMLTGFRCSGVIQKNEVINYPVQGAAFHCLLWSFIEIDRISQEEEWRSRLIGQIHDAAVLDVHPDELEHVGRTIKRVTCRDLPKAWDWIVIPLDVDAKLCPVDESWAVKESWKLPEV